jgi:nicotinamidase-related amidase
MSTSINNQQQKEEPPRYAILVNDMLNDFIQGSLRSDRANFIIPQIRLYLTFQSRKTYLYSIVMMNTFRPIQSSSYGDNMQ